MTTFTLTNQAGDVTTVTADALTITAAGTDTGPAPLPVAEMPPVAPVEGSPTYAEPGVPVAPVTTDEAAVGPPSGGIAGGLDDPQRPGETTTEPGVQGTATAPTPGEVGGTADEVGGTVTDPGTNLGPLPTDGATVTVDDATVDLTDPTTADLASPGGPAGSFTLLIVGSDGTSSSRQVTADSLGAAVDQAMTDNAASVVVTAVRPADGVHPA